MTMYSPLATEDQNHPNSTPPSSKPSIANVRRWWIFLFIFLFLLLLMTFSLDSSGAPGTSSIKPLPESYQLSDLSLHKLSPDSLTHQGPQKNLVKYKDNSCSEGPVDRVGFMKTHKTASSTVQNILMRFTLNSDWNFVMYGSGNHLGPPSSQYSLTRRFSRHWVDDVPWHTMVVEQGYNMFALHTKWSQEDVEKLLEQETEQKRRVKYITILRDPVDQFESLYNYVHFEKTFKMGLEEFVKVFVKGKRVIQRVNGYLGRNQQLWDLGLSRKDINNPVKVKEKIEQTHADFDLVMIAEEFQESLVLLSDVLCWPLANFTSLKLNARKKSAKDELSAEARSTLKDWLWADYMLYDYFKSELHNRKEAFGLDQLKTKVEELGEYNSKIKTACVLETVKNTKNLSKDFKPWSSDVLGFRVREEKKYCKYFGLTENQFVNEIRNKTLKRFHQW